MAKVLSYNDLIERKKYELSNNTINGLYDLIIPIGTPQSIIIDIIDIFDLDVEQRILPMGENDTNSTNVIVLRGSLEVVKKAEIFMKQELKKWMDNI